MHAWVEREGNKATIGCNASQQIWKLLCKGTTWVGHVGNCTQGENKHVSVVNTISKIMSSYVNLIFIILIEHTSHSIIW